MYIPVVRPLPQDSPPAWLGKWLLREGLHLPVKLAMAVDADRPWLTADAIRWLDANLRPDMTGFEWGSGRSTVYLGRRVRRLTSVEHKGKWFRRVRDRLERLGLGNVALRHMPTGPTPPSPLRPAAWKESGIISRKPEFAAYADAILDQPDGSLDFVLVDGRARVECAANARGKLKPGGFLVLDNSEWPKYRPVHRLLADWPTLVTANGVWRTSIFVKP